jgi:glycosyltransferase involved in cell wall biosynthesis
MKVIHLFAPGPVGGAEKVVASGVRELARQGVELELWLIREARNPKWCETFQSLLAPQVKCRIFDCAKALDLSLLRLLKTALRTHTGVLHTHAFKAAFYAYGAKPAQTVHVHTHHGQTAHTLKVRVYERLELAIMKRAQQVHAVSTAMKQQLLAFKVTNVELVENPLVLQNLAPRRERAVGSNFLYVGRLSLEKGVDVLLRALHRVQHESRCSLTIVGDGSEREGLQKLTLELGLEQVNFVGFQQSVNAYLLSADALVMPSRREGLPLTLIEALCAGLPVVASRVGGIPEFVVHGQNGFLCAPDDVAALALQLTEFLAAKEDISSQAKQRSGALTDRFSLVQWGARTTDLDKKVLHQS